MVAVDLIPLWISYGVCLVVLALKENKTMSEVEFLKQKLYWLFQ